MALNAARSLPPPPITGTECIDEKLALLSRTDLSGVNLITVGSSVTWRNLDFREFEPIAEVRPFNTAPCFLFVSQAAFLAELLLAGLPDVKVVLTVVAPRDMEQCSAAKEPFADRALLEDYIFERADVNWVYASNLRPLQFASAAIRRLSNGGAVQDGLIMDAYGSGFLRKRQDWYPEPVLDDDCFDALEELERIVTAHGARLVVASFPMSPTWSERHDPDGAVIAGFENALRDRLKAPDTIFVRSGIFATSDDDYADAVHLLEPAVPRYTRALVERLAPATL